MDWDNDGHLDILSGCYWTSGEKAGHIQLLGGDGTLSFSEAVALTNAGGKPLENATIEEPENGSMAENQTKTICTHQHAVDYDGDGDLDLVVGCFGPEFFLYENQGSDLQRKLSETPLELPIKSTSHHAAPHLADWDNDGDLDLLSGTAEGGVIISTNTGTRETPVWSKFQQLIPVSAAHEQSTGDGAELRPSPSTRVWTYDWNADGLLDLLVGDCANIVNCKDGVSPEEYETRLKEYNQNMAAVQEKNQAVYEEYSKVAGAGEAPSEELSKKLSEASRDMMEIYDQRNEFQDSKSTGFVWLYLRQVSGESTPQSSQVE